MPRMESNRLLVWIDLDRNLDNLNRSVYIDGQRQGALRVSEAVLYAVVLGCCGGGSRFRFPYLRRGGECLALVRGQLASYMDKHVRETGFHEQGLAGFQGIRRGQQGIFQAFVRGQGAFRAGVHIKLGDRSHLLQLGERCRIDRDDLVGERGGDRGLCSRSVGSDGYALRCLTG